MWNNCKVILLASKEKSRKDDLVIVLNRLGIHISNVEPSFHNKQHLYIISEDEIKEGNWQVNMYTKLVSQATELSINGGEEGKYKKIIATTDKSLLIRKDKGLFKVGEYNSLPQISQQFIEQYITEYNKGNIISHVLVEYEEQIPEGITFGLHGNDEPPTEIILKINQHNTINIKIVKDSFSITEVRKIAMDCMMYGYNGLPRDLTPVQGMNKWLEENL